MLGRRRRWARAALLVVAAASALAIVGLGYLASLPSVADAPARVRALLGAHGESPAIGTPPPKLAAAIVAVEDEHFHSPFAFDAAAGAGRAALAVLEAGGDPGGSTLIQQLAKQLYGGGPLRDFGLAIKLAAHYPKPQLLAMYLGGVYYGDGQWGEAAAARHYFGRPPGALDWAQATLLAGLPQAPSAYDPVTHFERAKLRQRHVLDRLVALHELPAARADAIFDEPLRVRRGRP